MGTPLEADDAQRLRDLRDAIAAAGDELSLPQLLALLTIAAEPNLSVNDLAERMGVPQQSASRFVAVLLGRYQSASGAGPKEPLIDQGVSLTDPRKRALTLTPAGQDLVTRMTGPGPSTRHSKGH
ncbi:MarR family winged helix-turn-helix transcriptional regulator [Methylobacterium oryzae]|uniref:MarR family winged helix-turn-helix transcriptional regulator n=1 Tax=Methylobacterium oryzae TaxID=334852 RepID=UPI002258C044|nr:MarR family winged helix-turn-helix transcriptional regulator [Methylobacterium organophilum]